MTEPTEGQPALAEPKKPVRRKSTTPRAPGKPRRAKASDSDSPLIDGGAEPPNPATAPAIETAPEPTPAVAQQPVVPEVTDPPAAPMASMAPEPEPRLRASPRPRLGDEEQIEDAAQILSRITSAPLSAAETVRENNARFAPRPQPQRHGSF